MNVVFVHDTTDAGALSATWLCRWPASVLSSKYVVDTMSLTDVLNPTMRQAAVLEAADVVIYERHIDDPWLPFLERMALTKRLFLTLDDAYWDAHPTTPTYRFWSKNGRLEKLMEVADWAEGIICPNRKLANHFPNGIFRPNRPDFNDPVWSVPPLFSDNVILWGGSGGHLAGIIDHPFLSAARRLNEEGIDVVCVSGSAELRSLLTESIPGAQVTPSMVGHNEWLKLVSGATLLANPLGPGYDSYKSWIKALEAACMGTRWVGSDVGVYDGAEGGVLIEDTEDAWYEAMKSQLTSEWDREATIAWAWKQGLHDHMDEWGFLE